MRFAHGVDPLMIVEKKDLLASITEALTHVIWKWHKLADRLIQFGGPLTIVHCDLENFLPYVKHEPDSVQHVILLYLEEVSIFLELCGVVLGPVLEHLVATSSKAQKKLVEIAKLLIPEGIEVICAYKLCFMTFGVSEITDTAELACDLRACAVLFKMIQHLQQCTYCVTKSTTCRGEHVVITPDNEEIQNLYLALMHVIMHVMRRVKEFSLTNFVIDLSRLFLENSEDDDAMRDKKREVRRLLALLDVSFGDKYEGTWFAPEYAVAHSMMSHANRVANLIEDGVANLIEKQIAKLIKMRIAGTVPY